MIHSVSRWLAVGVYVFLHRLTCLLNQERAHPSKANPWNGAERRGGTDWGQEQGEGL